MSSRREMIKQAIWLAILSRNTMKEKSDNINSNKLFQIGCCDWSLEKSSDVGVFNIAKEIGLDGVMVNMGDEKNNLHLRNKDVQRQYKTSSKDTGVKISSIAIAELNNVPYKSDPRTEEWVWDSIDVAKNLEVAVVMLAFFDKNDLRNDDAGKKEVINRLRKVAPHAEKNNIIIGLESYLGAEEHMEIIDKIGSKNIKVYYDFRNTADAGMDTIKEFKKLAKNSIVELHMKENGFLLGEGTLDWKAIGEAIYESGYYGDGWMQIEWASPRNADLITSCRSNLNFLRRIFSKPVQ